MRRPSSLRAALGTAIHAGTAAFDQARLDRRPIKPGDAAEVFVDALQNPDDEVDYKGDKTISLSDAEVIGLALTVKYCADVSPLFDFKSVEMKLQPMEINCGTGVVIRLTGTMDRARVAQRIQTHDPSLEIYEGGVIIPDIKTGNRIIENGQVAMKGKSAQLGVYQMMYENSTGESTAGGQNHRTANHQES